MGEKTAILMDGGFVKKKFLETNRKFPAASDVVALSETIMGRSALQEYSLFRVYFYDAPPFEGNGTNPIDGSVLNFSATPQARQNQALLQSLELQPNFAIRRGILTISGWKLGKYALKSIAKQPRQLTAKDFVPDMKQKGVDMRIGLDIAWLSLKGIVNSVVLVTGDSDFVPAMKFARREGIRIYLESLGHSIRRELRVHSDIVL